MESSIYKEKKVLITGGLGFIGSNVAHRLVDLGATVTLLDSLHPLYGGNLFNIEDIKDRVEVVLGDIRDKKLLERVVLDKDFIFDFAAQVSIVDSSSAPLEDLDVNCRGHLMLLETCRKINKNVKILFSSSRVVYGRVEQGPITETYPTNPTSIYGAHKLTAERYYQIYHNDHGIRSVIARLTNPYGVRQQIKHSKYSIPGWFMRLAMEGQPIKIFGVGSQVRDYIYIDDLAEALVALMGSNDVNDGIYNVGSGVSTKFKDMVEAVVGAVGKGSVEYVPWPENYKNIETGDSEISIAKLAKTINWQPKMALADGAAKMVDYYRKYKDKYINQQIV